MTQAKSIILIIDDNERMINYIEAPLTYCGFKVLSATTADEGLRLVKELRPDLIILDLKMPGTNGLEFLKQFRLQDREVPVILLSGYLDEFKDRITPEMNVFGYLPKRFYREELEGMVFDAIKRPESERTFSRSAKARILVVDDEVEIVNMLKSFFEERGYLVGTAHGGGEAIDLNKHFSADFLVSDIRLQGKMDGIDLAIELRKSKSHPKGVFFVSGVGDSQEVLNKMQEVLGGMQCIFTKPLRLETMEQLAQAIETFQAKEAAKPKAGG